jgi:PAS domain-containing protein
MSTAALDAMPDAAFLYDADGAIVYVNSMARVLFGLDTQPGFERGPLHERVARIAPRTADGQPLPHDPWHVTRLLRGEVITAAHPIEAFITSLDGRALFLSYTGAPIRDGAGQIVGASPWGAICASASARKPPSKRC